MSAFAGIFNLDAPLDEAALTALAGATGTATPGACRAEGRVALAAGAHGVLRVDARGRMLLGDLRIDNAGELRGMLGEPARRISEDADLVLAAYARWGERCVERLAGDFAFALWDPARQALFCARDPMGVRPFYYHQSERSFCFASDPGALLRLPGVPSEVDRERVRHFLLNTDAGRERTFHDGVRRLPAAHRLLRTPAAMSLQRYWEPDAEAEIRFGNDAQYADAFLELFENAVQSRVADSGVTAATLSGGLDSSSIVCMARRFMDAGAALHTISLIFPDLPPADLRLIDERKHMAAVTRGGGVTSHMVRGDRISPLGDARRIVEILREPFGAPNLYLHQAMFSAAADAGCTVFLDGFDGDSVVSHGLARLDDLLAAGDWPAYEREARAFANRRGTGAAKVARSYGVPRLDWLASAGRWLEWARTARALHRSFGFSRRELIVEHGWRRTAASQPPTARGAHVAGLMQPAYQETLETAYHCARAAGLDARFPFFDRRLIDFCVALPADQKFSDGWTRNVMRNAMRDVLPDEIRLRADKSNLLPAFHRGMRAVDAPLIGDVDLGDLGEFIDVDSVTRMRDEYLDPALPVAADADPMLLLRCATLAVWMEERSAHGQATGSTGGAGQVSHVPATMDGAAHVAAPRC